MTTARSSEQDREDRRDRWPRLRNMPSKAQVIVQSVFREPRVFQNIAAVAGLEPDVPDGGDSDGDSLSRSDTVELIDAADVRVLIRPNLDRDTRLRLLAKILDWEASEDRAVGTSPQCGLASASPRPRLGFKMPSLDFDEEEDDLAV